MVIIHSKEFFLLVFNVFGKIATILKIKEDLRLSPELYHWAMCTASLVSLSMVLDADSFQLKVYKNTKFANKSTREVPFICQLKVKGQGH